MNPDLTAVGVVAVILFMIGGYFGFCFVYSQIFELKESSGVVKYDDCRQKIVLTKSDYEDAIGTYVCSDEKTDSGKSMGGLCVKTVVDDSGQCQTAYVYQKPAEGGCGANTYLNKNDTCSCTLGYYAEASGSCVSIKQYCIDSYGENSYGGPKKNPDGYSSFEDIGNDVCYCKSGYDWNSDQTSCVAQ